MHHLFVNFGGRQRGESPPTPSPRRAATHMMQSIHLCSAVASSKSIETWLLTLLLNGHDKGPGVNDPSCRSCCCCHCCRRCCHHHTGRGETTNDEEGAHHCCHVSRRRAEKGQEGQRSGHAKEALNHFKNLAPCSVLLAACDSLLGRGRSKKKTALSQPQS